MFERFFKQRRERDLAKARHDLRIARLVLAELDDYQRHLCLECGNRYFKYTGAATVECRDCLTEVRGAWQLTEGGELSVTGGRRSRDG